MFVELLIAVTLPFACQSAMVGGMTDITMNINDPNAVFGLNSINAYYANQNDNDLRTLEKVVKAQSQVVSGISYKLTLQVKSAKGTENCELKIWSRSWMTGPEAMQVTEGPNCSPAPGEVSAMRIGKYPHALVKRAGGYSPASMDNEHAQNALSFAVDTINARANSHYLYKAVNVGQVMTQVVAGMHYKFTNVKMSATTCIKGSSAVLENCSVAANGNDMTCSFDIYWQAWMTPAYTMQNLKC